MRMRFSGGPRRLQGVEAPAQALPLRRLEVQPAVNDRVQIALPAAGALGRPLDVVVRQVGIDLAEKWAWTSRRPIVDQLDHGSIAARLETGWLEYKPGPEVAPFIGREGLAPAAPPFPQLAERPIPGAVKNPGQHQKNDAADEECAGTADEPPADEGNGAQEEERRESLSQHATDRSPLPSWRRQFCNRSRVPARSLRSRLIPERQLWAVCGRFGLVGYGAVAVNIPTRRSPIARTLTYRRSLPDFAFARPRAASRACLSGSTRARSASTIAIFSEKEQKLRCLDLESPLLKSQEQIVVHCVRPELCVVSLGPGRGRRRNGAQGGQHDIIPVATVVVDRELLPARRELLALR